MTKILTYLALAGLALTGTSCKPTYRKVPGKPASQQQQQQDSTGEEATAEPALPPTVEPSLAEPQKTAEAPAAADYSDCLMEVRCVTQEYNLLRPWEKTNPSSDHSSAVYIGDGKVIVNGLSPENAIYVELSLPDGSRSVAARIIKYDTDLDLALLTVAHDQDASIFDTRRAYPIGSPLHLGDKAELWCTVDGTIPASIPLLAESEDDNGSFPFICTKAARPLPNDLYSSGAPVICEGKLVGLTNEYSQERQSVTCHNAELLQRFLEEDAASNSAPVLGMQFEMLDDPVFRRYLKLDNTQCGLYVCKVVPAGAAAAAGIEKGDVLTSIEGKPLDTRGRWPHPIYGPTDAGVVLRSLKSIGQQVKLGISRAGEDREVVVSLNRDAVDNALPSVEKPGVPPRYIVWGGMVFQPLTQRFLEVLRSQARSLPVQFLEIEKREQELRNKGVTEIVALAHIIPTPATLGYESVAYSIVEKVNGKEIHNFCEFEEALDAPTADGLLHLSINRPPFDIYIDRQSAEAANDTLRRNAIHNLRRTKE